MTTQSTEIAEERYSFIACRVFDKIRKIREATEEMPAPEGETEITWGHVSLMARLDRDLSEILEWIESRE